MYKNDSISKSTNSVKIFVVLVLYMSINVLIILAFNSFSSVLDFLIQYALIIVISLFVIYISSHILFDFLLAIEKIKTDKLNLFLLFGEKIFKRLNVESPKILISNLKCDVLFVIQIGKENTLVISEFLLDRLDENGQKYLLSIQAHKIINNEVRLESYIAFFLNWPILLLDLLYILTFKFNMLILTYPLNFFRYILFQFYRIINSVLISNNRIFIWDYAASKILSSTEGFEECVKSIYNSPSVSSFFPVAFLDMNIKSSFEGIYESRFLNFSVQERIDNIKSIIG